MKKKKKKEKIEREQISAQPIGASQVLLGVRVSETERQKVKVYAARHGKTITELVREYIRTLPEDE